MRLFSDVSASIDDPHLRRAHHLAVRGVGHTSPNPAVGCVLVSDGAIVGEGWHERAGGLHAEASALLAAGERARGATAFVTLEPCAHHGRTPPCAQALIEAGISRVVIGMKDPNPEASGGAETLRAAGVEVVFVSDPRPFEELNDGWLKALSTGLPWVTAKVALSLDAKVARREGVRTAMSGRGSRVVTNRLRSVSDAVMVGERTARVDDPSLTLRSDEGVVAPIQPLRVVLCRDRFDADVSLLTDGAGPVAILEPLVCGDGSVSDAGDRPEHVVEIAYDAARGVTGGLHALAEYGCRRVLVEPGTTLMTALFDADAIDELVVIHAGGFAGESAPGIYRGEGEGSVTVLHRRMAACEAAVIDGDAVTVWRRRTYADGSCEEERKG